MGKRIEFDDAARDALRRGVDQLAGAVRVTLGPRGRNVVIEHGAGTPTITNDGLTIAGEIELENRFENMGVQLVKEAAVKTGEVAGDGTTTATVLAHRMVREGLRAVAAGHNPNALRRGMERAVATVVESLRERSRQVRDRADIERVATVSARHDAAIGRLIAEAMDRVGRRGVITVEEGRGTDTTLEVVEGLRFESGYLSPYFVTEPDTMEVTLENAAVLLADTTFSAARDLLPALERVAELRRPLFVVANDVEAEALALLVVNRLRGTVASVAVKAPGTGDRRREWFDDLAAFTGARLVASDLGTRVDALGPDDLGRVRRVAVDRESTTLLEGGGRADAVRTHTARLERARDDAGPGFQRDALTDRIARLAGGVAVVRVGGHTELSLKERRVRVEDALSATRSAVEEGIVPGGGVALLRAQPAVRALDLSGDESVGRDIVARALEEPAFQIAANAGEEGRVVVERIRALEGAFGFDAVSGRFVDLEEAGIVDPTRVVRCALQHAASIGGLVLTTDAIVVDEDEPETPQEGGES
jgi:chaperonin GroEL